ncbi:MAG TPA: ATP-binding protein [Gemmatimonadaceae bacterium]|nr:ATP-binding protein [Gemmatimonadaceae bacterium]
MMFEQNPTGIVLFDPALRIVGCNEAVARLIGTTRDKILGLHIDELRDQRPRIGVERALAGEIVRYESPYQATTTDTWFWGSATFAPLRDGAGRIFAIMVVVSEALSRTALREGASESETQLGEAQRLGRVGSWTWDADRKRASASPEFFRILGVETSNEHIGPGEFERFIHVDDRAVARAHFDDVLRDRLPCSTHEFRITRADGAERWVVLRAEVKYDERGRTSSAWGTMQDVTERRRLEEQLQRAQRMEALGHLASGVAHDFNNLLTVIRVEADFLQAGIANNDPLREDIREIQRAADRAAGLTKQLLAFSRKQILRPRLLDLNELVVETSTMLGRLIGEDVELVTTLARELPSVMADPGQLEQVLVNLAVNARDAMPAGGVLIIETGTAKVGPDKREHAAREYVTLTVADTGQGIEPRIQRQMFDPFFTTKPPGKGTGLGLSTVFGIVEQSGGHISVDSEPGYGARFTIRLPRAEADAIGAESSRGRGRGQRRPLRATVLIVEDEATLRTLAQRTLEREGYAVLAAEDGYEALAVADSFSGTIDLVLTDMVLPGLNGGEVAAQLARVRPGVRVVYMTGYTDDEHFQHGVLDACADVLEKPYTAAQLSDAVRRALESTPSAGEGE